MRNDPIKQIKLLYVAPRYHTNQVPIMKGFSENGCNVMFMAQYEGVSEVHHYVDFKLMKNSWISELIFKYVEKKNGPSQSEGKKMQLFIPAFFHTMMTIKQFAPDIVIIRERYIASLIVYWICRLLGIKKNILYVQQPIYDGDNNSVGIKRKLKKILFPRTVFSPVYYHGKKRDKVNKSDVYFVPLVVEGKRKSDSVKRKYFEGNIIRFLDIGKYREYKNHFFLIDVFAKLKKYSALSQVKLTVIGQVANVNEEEYLNRLQKYVRDKKLEDVIELRRNIPFEEMDSLYAENDVLLLPSTYESAGMVILEAMEKGLCVVASINCGLSSYLDEYQCGYTFQIDDTSEMEKILQCIISDREKIVQMGQMGCQVVHEKLLFHNYVESLNDLTEKEFGFSFYL